MSAVPASSPWIWCDGEWIAERDFQLQGNDRGVLHGLGAFETMRAEDGQLCFPCEHMARFAMAVASLGLAQIDLSSISAVTEELCERNGCQRGVARIRLTASAGCGALADSAPGKDARCWISATPWSECADPVVLGLLPWRKNANSPLTGLKSCCYAENLLALRYAKERTWNEGIFLNHREEICEAIMANLFIALDDEILTPPLSSGCLPGIMRGVVIAKGLAKEFPLCYEDLERASSVWISSALRGLVPASMVDGKAKHCRTFPV